MKIVCVNGSSSGETGSTQKIIDQIFAHFPKEETITFFPYRDQIKPCTGCAHCFSNQPICVIDDDMDHYIQGIDSCDLLILATPIYTNFMSANLKAVLDRIRPLQTGKYQLNQAGNFCPILRNSKKKSILLVATCGFPEMETFHPLECWFDSWCAMYDNFKIAGKILVPAAPFIIRRRPDLWATLLQQIDANIANLNMGRYFEIKEEKVTTEEMVNAFKKAND